MWWRLGKGGRCVKRIRGGEGREGGVKMEEEYGCVGKEGMEVENEG